MSYLIKGIVLLFCLSLVAEADVRIVGGSPAPSGNWPSTVALYSKDDDQQRRFSFFCGGTLIASRWVLTAAHCLVDKNTSRTKATSLIAIFAGSQDLTQKGDGLAAIKRIIVHPNYNTNSPDSDLALLELKEAKNIQTIPLYIGDAPIGTRAAVVGWGVRTVDVDGKTSNPSEILHELAVPVVSQAQCRFFMGNNNITNNMLCAGTGNGGQDSCQGDSGSPLMAIQNREIRLLGVVSWGEGCAKPNTYGVYTRLSQFNTWITSYTTAKPNIKNGGTSGGALFWMLFPFFGLLIFLKKLNKSR
ncbi:MAG: serine protease [Cocleimonas sp.]|nr:serine protease [Cocleimonas sp.]